MSWSYPENWSTLRYPWQRGELMSCLLDLTNPAETAKWLQPVDPNGPMLGLESEIEYFFDDLDPNEQSIGALLFDEAEVASLKELLARIDPVWEARPRDAGFYEMNTYALQSPLWPAVVSAASESYCLLAEHGVAVFTDDGIPG